MKVTCFARSALVVLVLLGLLSHQPVDAAGRKKKAKSKGKKSESAGLSSGATPSGNTDWKTDSLGSIQVKVKTSHLNLHKPPAFFTSLTTASRRPLLDAGAILNSKAAIEDSNMANITGSNQPKRVSADGFMLRMRYPKEEERNLTTTSARLNKWRVKWVAVTDDSPLLKSLEGLETEEERVDGRVSQTVAYVRLLRQLVMENPVMVNGLLGKEYELPESKQPKAKAKPAKKKADEKKKEEETTASTDSKEKKTEKTDADAAADDDAADADSTDADAADADAADDDDEEDEEEDESSADAASEDEEPAAAKE